MCNIDPVRVVVAELVKMRKSFTGKEVYLRMHNTRVHRDQSLSSALTEKGVSIRVRELFNRGDPTFAAYGSTLTNSSAGPILYFPLPAYAKRRIDAIVHVLATAPVVVALP